MSGHILLVEDDAALRDVLAIGLRNLEFDVAAVASAELALEHLGREDCDVVISDLNLGGMTGLELCTKMAETAPGVPLIVMTAFGSFDSAVEAVRAGAYDFLSKPVDVDVLGIAASRAIERRNLREEVHRLRDRVESRRGFGDLVGASPAMERVYDLMSRAAESEATVLVSGASGTGKELVARALHRKSRRSKGAFVAINCGAMPENLLESELFGHVRGAFTGASDANDGLLIEADGGTLFLDEIGEMPAPMQVKLLRVLQERTVRPVGGRAERPFDVRVVAATNRDLEAEVEEGKFREDLFYRLNVIQIELPPLRERGTDSLILAQHFLRLAAETEGREVAGLSPEAAKVLHGYEWPGNVRELQNCMQRAVALTRFDQIAVEDLPKRIREHSPTRIVISADEPDDLLPLAEIERRYILRTLEATGGNRTRAAKILGLDRKTLRRKIGKSGETAAK